jgi:hypothetical protein
MVYTQDLVDAVDAFRADLGLSTPALGSPPGYVDAEFLGHVWRALEEMGAADSVRARLLDVTQVRR